MVTSTRRTEMEVREPGQIWIANARRSTKRELDVVAKRTDSWFVLGWLGKVARQLRPIEDVDNKKPMPHLKQSLKK